MSKSISQQVREKVQEASAKAEQHGVPPEATEAVSFISSATPTPEEQSINANTAEAPEASDASPLAPASSAETPSEAAPAAETKTPTPNAPQSSASTPTSSAPHGSPTGTATDAEEWEDAEWDDDSVGTKYRIRAPKGMAEKIKGGWMAHADYSRKAARLAHFQSEFQPMIESGYMDRVLPVYKALNQDEVLANAVAHLYQQRMANQPLSYTQPGTEQYVQPQAQPQQQEEQPYADDPYLQSIMQPIRSEIGQMRSYLEEQSRSAEQQRAQVQQAETRRTAELAEWSQIHQQLHRSFPEDFRGDPSDLPKLQQLRDYADRAGYSRESHGWYGRILTAKQDIDRFAPRPVTAPPQAVSSAGAAAVQAQAEEIARRARTEVANGTVVSGSAQPAEPPPAKPARLRDKQGNPLPVKQAMTNIIRSARARTEATS